MSKLYYERHINFNALLRGKDYFNVHLKKKSQPMRKKSKSIKSFLVYSSKKTSNSLNDEMVCFVARFHFQSISVHVSVFRYFSGFVCYFGF